MKLISMFGSSWPSGPNMLLQKILSVSVTYGNITTYYVAIIITMMLITLIIMINIFNI